MKAKSRWIYPGGGLMFCLIFTLASAVANAQEGQAITGRVVTDTGKPLPNVSIRLSSSNRDGREASSRSTFTDENGEFQFKNLPDRNYDLSFSVRGGYTPKQPRPDGQRTTGLRPGDSTTITMMKGGVITGRVTDPDGEPLVGIGVSAIPVRNDRGQRTIYPNVSFPRTTDDRGVYRLYGLSPGTYLVAANAGPIIGIASQSAFYGQVPTYHPSSTRDTATEVKVASGDEVSDVDIRYRGEAGRTVSGKLSGGESSTLSSNAIVSLRDVATGASAGSAATQKSQNGMSFAISGIGEGEYELTANWGGIDSDESFSSEPRRVTVKKVDVTGIELRLIPAATLAGRIAVEPSATVCDAKLKISMEDSLVVALRDEKADATASSRWTVATRSNSPDAKGEFKLRNLIPGRYRLNTSLPGETWFVKSINAQLPPNSATVRPAANDLVRAGVLLKPGEKVSGVAIAMTDGGATLGGKVTVTEGSQLPSKLRVYLVPAEPARAEDLLRYAERVVDSKGSFAFISLAPGKYWLLARLIPDSGQFERQPLPLAWDTVERAKLRKDAEAAKNEIELKTCQRVKDHLLRF